MGTTLTGTTPQDTYDALIKVGDNGIITGSLKTLSDGEGHDTALALSTGAASVTGTLAVSSTSVFGNNIALSKDDSGITSNTADGADNKFIFICAGGARGAARGAGINFFGNEAVGGTGRLDLIAGSVAGGHINLQTNGINRLTATFGGNVGIGTSVPSVRFTVKGDAAVTQTIGGITVEQCAFFLRSNEASTLRVAFDASANAYIYSSESGGILNFGTRTAPNNNIIASVTANGVTFNGDTAAANALDDYEEGTWTPALAPATSGTLTVQSPNLCAYTKIGRLVTINGLLEVTAISSPIGATVTISGLPFTSNAVGTQRTAGTLTAFNLTTGTVSSTSVMVSSTTSIVVMINASLFQAGSQMYFQINYTV